MRQASSFQPWKGLAAAAGIAFGAASGQAAAAVIPFDGPLAMVLADEVGAIFSGSALGTVFSGSIDDASFAGQISNGVASVSFGCCIAAGGLTITNDAVLDATDATVLNTLAGAAVFSAGEVVDLVDIEGDSATPGGGRIEVGLSYVLKGDAFASTDPGNYPFDPVSLRLAAYFVFEQDAAASTVYHGLGALNPVPEPAAWLLGLAGGAALLARRRQRDRS